MIELSLDKVNALLDRAVADRGADFVYHSPVSSCLYWHDAKKNPESYERACPPMTGQPGCIVGYVLHLAGVSDEAIESLPKGIAGTALDHLTSRGVIDLDSDSHGQVYYLLNRVQCEQDARIPWGQAVSEGRRVLAEWQRRNP